MQQDYIWLSKLLGGESYPVAGNNAASTVNEFLRQHHRAATLSGGQERSSLFAFAGQPAPGKWFVPDHRWHELLWLLTREHVAAAATTTSTTHGLVEVRTPVCALAIDLDIPGSVDLFGVMTNAFSFMAVASRVALRHFRHSVPTPVLITSSSGEKHGKPFSSFHVHWPLVEAFNTEQVEFVKLLRTECSLALGNDHWHGCSWEKLIDSSIYHAGKGLRMMWCDKLERSGSGGGGGGGVVVAHKRPKVPHAFLSVEEGPEGAPLLRRLSLPRSIEEAYIFALGTRIRRPASTRQQQQQQHSLSRAGVSAVDSAREKRRTPPATMISPSAKKRGVSATDTPTSNPGGLAATMTTTARTTPTTTAPDASLVDRVAEVCLALVRRARNPSARRSGAPRHNVERCLVYVSYANARHCPFRLHDSNNVYTTANLITSEVLLCCHDKVTCSTARICIGRLPEELVAVCRRNETKGEALKPFTLL